MGQMKKLSELIDKYDKLKGKEKEAVKEAMELLKEHIGYNDTEANLLNQLEDKDVNTRENV